MEITHLTQLFSGVTLLSMVTIESGGIFLLSLMKGNNKFTSYQLAMFKAGHAHAGVLAILCVVAQLLIGTLVVTSTVEVAIRVGFVSAALLISGGFFAAASHRNAVAPNRWIGLVYIGAVVLATSLVWLGILLVQGK